jgi:hypothetical protein
MPLRRPLARVDVPPTLSGVDVTFEVEGSSYRVPEQQAAILAENLRVLARSELTAGPPSTERLGPDDDWRDAAIGLANSIEQALVEQESCVLVLERRAADAAYCVLRLMVGIDANGATGLRDALGAPLAPVRRRRVLSGPGPQQLSRPELLELLAILFVLAILTVIAGVEWTGDWYLLAPAIAALLGLRVATTRAAGRLAWSFASVLWWAILLVPAAVLSVLIALLLRALVS